MDDPSTARAPSGDLTRAAFARRAFVALGALGGLAVGLPRLALGAATATERRRAPKLRGLTIMNGLRPYRGDNRMRTTISSARRRNARRVTISFNLTQSARVQLEVVKSNVRGLEIVDTKMTRLKAGRRQIVWQAPRGLAARTYLLRMRVTDARGRTTLYGGDRPTSRGFAAPVVRVLGIEAAFRRRSYAPGERAQLRIETDAAELSVEILHSGSERTRTQRGDVMRGTPVSPPVSANWRRRRFGRGTVSAPVGDWPSGLYFARVTTSDGRTGFAPFVVRPRSPGPARVAVVLPTHTWQAYNFLDRDGDGWGDTWYAGSTNSIDLDRPFLNNGVPPRFRLYDLPFLRWLDETGKQFDLYAEDDLERFKRGDDLRVAYDLVVFSGHSEYVTAHAYVVTQRFRDLGGNLMFLSANSFFWRVRKKGSQLERIAQWRDSGRPEARLIGAQYLANDDGSIQDAFVVTGAELAPWVFEGTGLTNGSVFGQYGIEIDHTTPQSPPETIVLAEIPDLFGPGRTAQMTYYETDSGAKVFGAGVLAFGIRALQAEVSQILDNVWRRLTAP